MDSPRLSILLGQLPYLRRLVDEYGEISLFDYGKAHYRWMQNNDTLFLERKAEFLGIIRTYVSWKFDDTMAHAVAESLSKNYAVSTAEHHGPMGHPFFFQSALLRGIVNPGESIVNLCTSHVSLGNSSYPRGIVFHGDGANAPSGYIHLPFFPTNKRMSPVFRLWGYREEYIREHTRSQVTSFLRDKIITESAYDCIQNFFNNFILREDVLWEKRYSSQITKLNSSWWNHMFPNFPAYIPLDAEDIVRAILIKHIEKNTAINQIMTNIAIQPMIEEYFNGISCCFERNNKRWTYLFWHLDEKNNRHALWREWNKLVCANWSFQVQLDSPSILYALNSESLIPSGLLVYTTLSCYYGLKCFWGFSQGNYLPKIQQAYKNILQDIPWAETYLGEEPPILNEDMVFLYEKSWEISTALDLYINDDLNTEKVLYWCQKTTLKESLEKMTWEIERCL